MPIITYLSHIHYASLHDWGVILDGGNSGKETDEKKDDREGKRQRRDVLDQASRSLHSRGWQLGCSGQSWGGRARLPASTWKGALPPRKPACQHHLFCRAIPGPLCPTPEPVKFSLLLPSNVSRATVSLMIRSPSPGKTARLTSKHMHLASTQHTLAEWMTPCAVRQSEIPNSEVTIVWKQECQGSKKKCEKVKAMWRDYLCICVLKKIVYT